jgi:hypothetical protein
MAKKPLFFGDFGDFTKQPSPPAPLPKGEGRRSQRPTAIKWVDVDTYSTSLATTGVL